MSKLIDWNQFDEKSQQSAGGLVDWNQFDEPVAHAAPDSMPQYQFAQPPEPMAPPPVQYNEPAGPVAPPAPMSMRDRAIGVLSRELPKTARSFDLYANIADTTPAIQEARQADPGEYWKQLGEGGMYGINQLMDASQYFTQLPVRAPAALLGWNSDFLFPKGTEPDAIDSILGRRNYAPKWKEEHPATLPATYDVGKYLSQMILPGGLGSKATTYGGSIGLGALEGAGQGFVTGVADQMSDGKFDPLGLALNTGLGAGFGGAAGGVGQFLGRVFPKKGVPGAAPTDPSLPPDVPPDPPGGMISAAPKVQAPRQMSIGETSPEVLQEPEMSDVLGRLGLKPKNLEPVQLFPASQELVQQELVQYPHSFKRYGSEAQGRLDPEQWYMPSELPDKGLDQTIEWLENLIKYSKDPAKRAGFRLPANSKEQLQAMISEKMRREQRRVAGIEPDWPQESKMLSGSVEQTDFKSMSLDELNAVDDSNMSREEQQRLADAFMQKFDELQANHDLPPAAQTPSSYTPKETGTPEIPGVTPSKAPNPVERAAPKSDLLADLGLKPKNTDFVAEPDIDGEFRLRRNSFGRNKVDKAHDAAMYSQEVQDAVNEVAQKKVTDDYRKSVLNSYSKRLWEKLKLSGLVTDADTEYMHNGIKLSRKPDDKLPSYINGKLEQLREKLAFGVEQGKSKQHVAAVLGSEFGREGPHGVKSFDIPIPDDMDRAFANLEKLHLATTSEAKLANSSKKAYDYAKEQAKPAFESAQQGLREKNPLESFTARTKVKAPFGEDVDVAVSLDRQAKHLKLTQEAEEIYKAAQDAEMQKLAANRNRVPKFKFSVDARKSLMKKAMAVFGLGLLAQPQKAEAATPGGSSEEKKNPFKDLGALSRLAIGAALVHTLAPKLAKQLVTKNFMHSNVIFNDTIQRVAMLDDVLGTDVAKQIWMHQGAIFNSSFGVKVDAELRAEAMRALRQGEVSIKDALQGTAGTVFEGMSPEARTAIVEAEKIKQSLKGIVKTQLENFDEYVKEHPNQKALSHTRDALKEVLSSFEASQTDSFDKYIYKPALSKFMDYHFFYNPAFHLTNLSDQLIAGGTRVGPTNLYKANVALNGGNKSLMKLMENSNLTGGFEAERINTALEAGKKGFKVKDFKSDKINADRVALGSIFQYASANAKTMGWTGTEEEFAEQLLKGKLDPEIAVDAYAHMAETISRTLGVDPLRVNTDVFSSSAAGKYLSVFVKQPARISNLLMHHLADGNLKYFYMMLGATALAGGKAAIPTDVGYAWERVDPASYFAAAAMLDKAELLQYATGKTMSPKLQWAILAPFVSSSDPLRSNVGRTMQDGMDALSKISEGEGLDRKKGYALLGNALSIFAPRVAGLPTKQIINGLSAADSALFEDTIPVAYYDQFGKSYGQKEEFPRQEMGLTGAKQFMDNFLPGESSSINYQKQAKREETRRGKNLGFGLFGDATQSTPFFQTENKKQKDPLNFLFRGGK